jgi:hypothetical protein
LSFAGIVSLRSPARAAATLRIVVLPLVDRASVVIEGETDLIDATGTHEDCGAAAECLVAEAGPIPKSTAPANAVASPSIRFVKSVRLEPYTRPDGQTYVRVRVQVTDRCERAVRFSGKRLYLDFAPVRQNVARGEGIRAPAREAAAAEPPRAPAREAAAQPLDYDSLKADVLRRAEQHARKPDVKALLALIDEVHRKDDLLGRQRPDLVAALLDEVNRLLDEARVRQLDLDRQALRKPDGKK